MRRPRAGDERNPPSSRTAPGLGPGTLGSPARSWRAIRLARGSKDAATRKGQASQSRRQGETERQKARPGAVTTSRWSAERRARLARRAHAARRGLNKDAPLGAPSPRIAEGKKGTTAYPAPPRIRAAKLARLPTTANRMTHL